jgi:serine/threonine protein kinase
MNGGNAAKDSLLALVEAQHKVQDRYADIKRLGGHGGHGNFSLIFTATDTQTGSVVVLKVFHPFTNEQYRWKSFHREAEILGLLKGQEGVISLVSPIDKFVQVLEVEPYKIKIPVEFSYYVVELAAGDVEQIIESGNASTEQLLLIFMQMCKVVQRIHRASVVHRDIKPSNFLTLKDETIRLSDFGTARLINDFSKPMLEDYAGLPPGDIRYTAPEIISSLHDVSPHFAFKGDMFSLGATLFELFTGAVLGNQIFDIQFQENLIQHMAVVPRDERRETYDGFVSEMADAHPLPNIEDYAPSIRRCVLPIIADLYKRLAALDYRKRTADFEYVFLKVRQALIVLRNEDKLKKWREQREVYRQNREKKHEAIRVRFASKALPVSKKL